MKELIAQNGEKPQTDAWLETIQTWKTEYPLSYDNDGSMLKPQKVIEMLYEKTNGEATVVTDVGQHQMWAAQFYKFKNAHKWVTSGGLGNDGLWTAGKRWRFYSGSGFNRSLYHRGRKFPNVQSRTGRH